VGEHPRNFNRQRQDTNHEHEVQEFALAPDLHIRRAPDGSSVELCIQLQLLALGRFSQALADGIPHPGKPYRYW
jgi:hypothetical protein